MKDDRSAKPSGAEMAMLLVVVLLVGVLYPMVIAPR
jgi:hypothetical protein